MQTTLGAARHRDGLRRIARLLGALPALAAAAASASAPAPEPWPQRLQQQMARTAAIGWRLNDAAAALCPVRAAPIGAQLDYIGAYAPSDRRYVAEVLGLGEAPQVFSVIPDSPAALAGLRPGDELVAVNGQAWRTIAAGLRDPDLVADELQAQIAAVPADHPLVLAIRRGAQTLEVPIARAERCAVGFVVKSRGGLDAYSDSANVAISAKLVDFAGSDDELALILAHELAHVMYQDKRAMPLRTRRLAEDRADYAGALLARCAGYDIARGAAVFRRIGKHDWLDWLGAPTHRSMRARAARLQAMTPGGAADACPLAQLPAAAE